MLLVTDRSATSIAIKYFSRAHACGHSRTIRSRTEARYVSTKGYLANSLPGNQQDSWNKEIVDGSLATDIFAWRRLFGGMRGFAIFGAFELTICGRLKGENLDVDIGINRDRPQNKNSVPVRFIDLFEGLKCVD